MERKVSLYGQLFYLHSLSPVPNGDCEISYWIGEIDASDLKQITVHRFITLKAEDLEIIKVMR